MSESAVPKVREEKQPAARARHAETLLGRGIRKRQLRSSPVQQSDGLEEVAAQLMQMGKVAFSLRELTQIFPWSARTIRRAEIAGHIHSLKLARKKAFLLTEVLNFIERIR